MKKFISRNWKRSEPTDKGADENGNLAERPVTGSSTSDRLITRFRDPLVNGTNEEITVGNYDSQLRKHLADRTVENRKLANKVRKLEAALQAKLEENERLAKKIDDVGPRNSVWHSPTEWYEIQTLVKRLDEENGQLREQLGLNTAKLQDLSGTLKFQTSELDSLKSALIERDGEKLQLEQKVQILTIEFDSLQSQYSKVIAERNERISAMEYKTAFQECKNLLEQLRNRHQSELAQFQKQVTEGREEKRILALRLAESDMKLSLASGDLAQLRKTLKVVNAENRAMLEGLANNERKLKSTEVSLKDLISQSQSLMAEKKAAEVQASTIQSQLEQIVDGLRKKSRNDFVEISKLKTFKEKATILLSETKDELLANTSEA